MATRKTKGAKGGGTIRQRPDGRWEARYTLGIDPGTGKQIQKSVYGKTQKEERQKLTEALPQREAEIQRLKETVSNTAAFLDKAKRYTDIQELTPELLRLFIQKIVVHEKEVKWSKHAPQTVEIHYADIGCMENRQTAKPKQHKEIPMVS